MHRYVKVVFIFSGLFMLATHGVSTPAMMSTVTELHLDDKHLQDRLKIEANYVQYVTRQQANIRDIQRQAEMALPDDLDLESVHGLSTECKEVLAQARPANVSPCGCCWFQCNQDCLCTVSLNSRLP